MPLRVILRYLLNNEALIQKLSETYPMRRAAQLTSYVYHKGKVIGEETMEKVKEAEISERLKIEGQNLGQRASRIQRRLSDELQEGMKELKDEMEKQRKKQ